MIVQVPVVGCIDGLAGALQARSYPWMGFSNVPVRGFPLLSRLSRRAPKAALR